MGGSNVQIVRRIAGLWRVHHGLECNLRTCERGREVDEGVDVGRINVSACCRVQLSEWVSRCERGCRCVRVQGQKGVRERVRTCKGSCVRTSVQLTHGQSTSMTCLNSGNTIAVATYITHQRVGGWTCRGWRGVREQPTMPVRLEHSDTETALYLCVVCISEGLSHVSENKAKTNVARTKANKTLEET